MAWVERRPTPTGPPNEASCEGAWCIDFLKVAVRRGHTLCSSPLLAREIFAVVAMRGCLHANGDLRHARRPMVSCRDLEIGWRRYGFARVYG